MRVRTRARNPERIPNSPSWTMVISSREFSRALHVWQSKCGSPHSSQTWSRHGGEQAEILGEREQGRRERDAPAETRHASERTRRKGRQGEVAQTGDRDRVVRSAREGKEGPPQARRETELEV